MSAAFYNLKATKADKSELKFDTLRGKVVLIVNTASQCGFTPQYAGLQKLYEQYRDQGFTVLGFPSNSFFQEREPENVGAFCQKNFGVQFDLMEISDVNGSNTNEVFAWLKKQKGGKMGISMIKWNFTKFLVDSEGTVVERYGSTTKPSEIAPKIEELLKVKAKA